MRFLSATHICPCHLWHLVYSSTMDFTAPCPPVSLYSLSKPLFPLFSYSLPSQVGTESTHSFHLVLTGEGDLHVRNFSVFWVRSVYSGLWVNKTISSSRLEGPLTTHRKIPVFGAELLPREDDSGLFFLIDTLGIRERKQKNFLRH